MKTLVQAVLDGAVALWREVDGGPPGLSRTGKCPRAISFAAHGRVPSNPPDAAALVSFEKGRRSEDAILAAVVEGGFKVTDRQRHVNLDIGLPGNPLLPARVCDGHRGHPCGAAVPAGCVPGHIDGMVGPVLLELKETTEGKAPTTLRNGEVREGYGFLRIAATGGAGDDSYFGRLPRMQVTACVTALRRSGVRVDYGKILYANKGVKKGQPVVAEVDVDVNPADEAAVVAWWRDVYVRAASGLVERPATLDPYPNGRPLNRGHEACRYCDFEDLCWGGPREG